MSLIFRKFHALVLLSLLAHAPSLKCQDPVGTAPEYLAKPVGALDAIELLSLVQLLAPNAILEQESFRVNLEEAEIVCFRIWAWPDRKVVVIEKAVTSLKSLEELQRNGRVRAPEYRPFLCWKDGVTFHPMPRAVLGAGDKKTITLLPGGGGWASTEQPKEVRYGAINLVMLQPLMDVQVNAFSYQRRTLEGDIQELQKRRTDVEPEVLNVLVRQLKAIASEDFEVELDSKTYQFHRGKGGYLEDYVEKAQGVVASAVVNTFHAVLPAALAAILSEIEMLEKHGPDYQRFKSSYHKPQLGLVLIRNDQGDVQTRAIDYLGGAYIGGVRKGDVIEAVDGIDLHDLALEDVKTLLVDKQPVSLSIKRGSERFTIENISNRLLTEPAPGSGR